MSEPFELTQPAEEDGPQRRSGMGSHESAKMGKDEWLTPPDLKAPLGEFDLDPCAPIARPWNTARQHFTILDNGLRKKWFGRVWLNPPYGDEIGKWMGRMAEHGRGTALIFARTETAPWRECIWKAPSATAVLFVYGRIYFHHVSGERGEYTGGAPSAFIAYGREDAEILKRSGIAGFYIDLELQRASGNVQQNRESLI